MDAVEPVLEADVARSGHPARWVALAVGVVLLAFLAVLATRTFGADTVDRNPLIGRAVPPLEGETIDGATFDIDDHRGQWVVVNFFATWCIPCRVEHPELVRFAESHAETGDVVVVSVAFDDEADAIREFFATNGGDWAVIPRDTTRTALDFGVTGVPESYVVAPNGLVVAGFQGVTAEALDEVIDRFEAAAGEESTP